MGSLMQMITFFSMEKALTLGRLPKTMVLEDNKHYYSDSAYYFLKVNDTAPLRISTENNSVIANRISDSFQDFLYVETDQYSPAKSGREFYGDLYDAVLSG